MQKYSEGKWYCEIVSYRMTYWYIIFQKVVGVVRAFRDLGVVGVIRVLGVLGAAHPFSENILTYSDTQ